MGDASRYYPGFPKNKWSASDVATGVGMLHVGNIYYVDAANGSDTANAGKRQNDAFKTVTTAHAAMTADQDDVLVIAGESATGRTSEAAAITWSKRRTHIIGNGPARRINSRNGVAAGYSGGTTTAVFTITGNNCSFSNISFATFNDNNLLVEIQSDYNTFRNVHFQGIGNDTTGDDADARSLYLNASEENEFYNCTIGLDTVTRSAANSSLELSGSCARNKFFDCDFPMFADAATPTWIKADTGNAYERFMLLDRCNFYNPDGSSSTTLTIGFDLSTTGNGDIYMRGCDWRGATDLANNYTRLFADMPVVDTGDQGLMIIQAT